MFLGQGVRTRGSMIVATISTLILAVGASVVPLGSNGASAAPAVQSRFVPVSPQRLMDTRSSFGSSPVGKPVAGGTVSTLVAGRAGVPSTATAVVLNVTATQAAGGGYVTVFPSGTPQPTASNLNTERVGHTIPNLVTVRLGSDGRVAMFTAMGVHLIADVFGYYEPMLTTRAGRFVAMAPNRQVDSRSAGGIVAAGGVRRVPLPAAPAGASAVVLNVTVVSATGAGFWTVYAAGSAQPGTSNLNVTDAGQTIANQVILPAGAGGIDIFSQAGGHVIVDMVGSFTGAADALSDVGLFVPMAPTRFLDTRGDGALNPLGRRMRLLPGWTVETPVIGRSGIPSNISAVVMNTTVTEATRGGFVTLFGAGAGRPLASNLNAERSGHTVANHTISPVTSRGVSAYASGGTHLIEDLTGYFTGVPAAAMSSSPSNAVPRPVFPMQLSIPEIGMTTPFYDNIVDSTLTTGAGHWPGTALPGQDGNMAVFGHRTSNTRPFGNIDQLNVRDEVIVKSAGYTYTYRVVRTFITSPSDVETFGGWTPTPSLSLVACHPPGSVAERIVVRAELYDVSAN